MYPNAYDTHYSHYSHAFAKTSDTNHTRTRNRTLRSHTYTCLFRCVCVRTRLSTCAYGYETWPKLGNSWYVIKSEKIKFHEIVRLTHTSWSRRFRKTLLKGFGKQLYPGGRQQGAEIVNMVAVLAQIEAYAERISQGVKT